MKSYFTDENRLAISDVMRQPSDDVYECVLQADIVESLTIPTNPKPRIAIFNYTSETYVNPNGIAVKPTSGNFVKNTGSENSPVIYDVSNVTSLSMIGSTADNIVTVAFYL